MKRHIQKKSEENIIVHHIRRTYGVFLKWGVPQKGWFMMENSIDMDDFGVPHGTLFQDPPYHIRHFRHFCLKHRSDPRDRLTGFHCVLVSARP